MIKVKMCIYDDENDACNVKVLKARIKKKTKFSGRMGPANDVDMVS